MHDLSLLLDLVLAAAAGALGGFVAHRSGQPVILGYIVAGVVIGPFTPGPVGNVEHLAVLAEAGVALLMFALGAELSLGDVRRVGRVAVVSGVVQVLGSTALGFALGPLLGLDPFQAAFFGALMALSSSVVAIKLLSARGELGSVHGRIAVGILIVQDLSLVPMMVILPALSRPADSLLIELGLAVATAAALLVGTYVAGTRLVPWILDQVVGSGSRELFILALFVLALGTALGAQLFGLSLAFGAFLAGIVVSESQLSHQVVAEIVPLRDLFATVFFVSVGMLLDPLFIVYNAPAVALMAGVAVLGKAIIVAVLVRAFGWGGRAALLAGLGLAPIGEFSFVLARLGVEELLIDAYLYNLTLAAAVVTIVLSPAALRLAEPLMALARRLGLSREGRDEVRGASAMDADTGLRQHTIICGFGRVGRELAAALDRRGFRYLVVEADPRLAVELRERNVPVILGDAASPVILRHAGVARAKVLAVTVPDLPTADRTVREARLLHPRLDIVARAPGGGGPERLRRAGAAEVVRPEFETGLEFVRHTLRRYGVAAAEVQAIVSRRRAEYYGDTTGRA